MKFLLFLSPTLCSLSLFLKFPLVSSFIFSKRRTSDEQKFYWYGNVTSHFFLSYLKYIKVVSHFFQSLNLNWNNSCVRWRSSLRLSLEDIMRTIDTNAEFCWKKKLWFEIGKTEVVNTLTSCSSNCILPFFKSCAKEGFDSQILEVLDQGNESVVFFFSFLFFFLNKICVSNLKRLFRI